MSRVRTAQGFHLIIMAGLILNGVFKVQVCQAAEALQTRLVPLEPAYEIGKPMMLRVELVNTGSTPVSYYPYSAYAAYNGRLIIKGPDGQVIPYIGPWSSDQESMGTPSPMLEAGGSVPVFTIDLAATYFIDRPGRYTLQHNGEFIPKAGPIDVMVRPGRLSEADEVVGHLRKEFGVGWTLEKALPNDSSPEPFRSSNTIVGVAVIEGVQRMLESPVVVWQVRQLIDPSMLQKNSSKEPPIEYLGRNWLGVVYAQDGGSLNLRTESVVAGGILPRVRKSLIQALEVIDDRGS